MYIREYTASQDRVLSEEFMKILMYEYSVL